jgi:hypothetical protein
MTMQARLPWGIHGLTKLLPRSAVPYPSMPCGRPPLKRAYGHFRSCRPQGGQPVAVLLKGRMRMAMTMQARIPWGIHGLTKLLPRSAVSYPSMPCGRPPLKRAYGHFRGCRPQGRQPVAVLLKGMKRMRMAITMQARIPWGFHGLTKILFGPAMHSTPCRQPPLKHPYGRFKDGRLQGGQLVVV